MATKFKANPGDVRTPEITAVASSRLQPRDLSSTLQNLVSIVPHHFVLPLSRSLIADSLCNVRIFKSHKNNTKPCNLLVQTTRLDWYLYFIFFFRFFSIP